MAAIELPDILRRPSAFVSPVEGEWAPQFCRVHALVAQVRAGHATLRSLEESFEEEFPKGPPSPVFSRILAWEQVTAGERNKGLITLLQAIEAFPGDENLYREISYLEESGGEHG
jgi:hypothetical protein